MPALPVMPDDDVVPPLAAARMSTGMFDGVPPVPEPASRLGTPSFPESAPHAAARQSPAAQASAIDVRSTPVRHARISASAWGDHAESVRHRV
jgi:hypothetical protein